MQANAVQQNHTLAGTQTVQHVLKHRRHNRRSETIPHHVSCEASVYGIDPSISIHKIHVEGERGLVSPSRFQSNS